MVTREPESKKKKHCTAPIAMMSERAVILQRSTATTSPSGAPVAATPGSRPLPASATGGHHKASAPILPALSSITH